MEIETKLSSNDIVEQAVKGFSTLLLTHEVGEVEVNESTLLSYLAGIMKTLTIVGFEDDEVRRMSLLINKRLKEIANECDCPNCK